MITQAHLRTPILSLVLLSMVPIALWQNGLSTSLNVFASDAPAGQTFYVLAKLMGLLAITLAGAQLLIGYTLSPVTQRLHIILGSGLLAASLSHWLCFSIASYQRTDDFPFHLLQPWTDGAYYHTGIMFGALALWVLLGIVLTGLGSLRRRAWAKAFHRLGVGVFVLALVHAWMIGTEANSLWGKLFLVMLTGVVALAMMQKWWRRYQLAYSIKPTGLE